MKVLLALSLVLSGCATAPGGAAREPAYIDFSGLRRFSDYVERTRPEPTVFPPSRAPERCQTVVTYDSYGVPSYRQFCQ